MPLFADKIPFTLTKCIWPIRLMVARNCAGSWIAQHVRRAALSLCSYARNTSFSMAHFAGGGSVRLFSCTLMPETSDYHWHTLSMPVQSLHYLQIQNCRYQAYTTSIILVASIIFSLSIHSDGGGNSPPPTDSSYK